MKPETQGEGNVKERFGVINTQAKERQRLPANHQKLGRIPHWFQRELGSADTLVSDFCLQNRETTDFC